MTKVEQNLNGTTVATTYEFQFPQKKEPMTIAQFFYDRKTGAVCGRTPKSWFQIVLFYLVFYAVLAALFAVCMQGLFATLYDGRPSYILDGSLIGTNPGLGFRPINEDADYGGLILFKHNSTETMEFWTDNLDKFLEQYDDSKKPENQRICGFGTVLKPDEVCAVSLEKFDPCLKKNMYGYNKSAPCVFLKLNKIYDWVPEYYDNVSALPDEMPEDLKWHIKQLPSDQHKQIWVSCGPKGGGKNSENIGPIKYLPVNRGFPSYYYPYKNIHGYLSPLIAVHFERPKLHTLIVIECRAWAKNIIYSGSMKDRKGSVEFQLLID